MKIYFLLLICCTIILADQDEIEDDVASDKSSERQICETCTCESKTKTINCVAINLFKAFTEQEWVTLNDTKTAQDIIRFDHNGITKIPAFPDLQIRVLSFKENAINTIVPNAFRELEFLEELDLSGNNLTFQSLRPEVFAGKYDAEEFEPLRKLRILHLGKNRIHTLDSDIFEHLPSLEVLNLNDNPFMVLDVGTTIAISNIPQLKYLDLSYMELTTLPEHIFHAPHLLTNLNLTGNLMKVLPDALYYAVNLEFLALDENPMTNLEGSNVFPQLEKLQTLHLSYIAPMKNIDKGALSGLRGLKNIVITNNPHLSQIHSHALSRPGSGDVTTEEWPVIKKIDLSNNNISILPAHLLGRWDNLEYIDIRFNPWQCDCENQFLLDTVIPVIMKETAYLSHAIVCDTPIELIGIELSTLKQKETKLRCLDKYNHRPEGDGAILVGILLGLLIGIPISLGILFVYRRGCFGLLGYTGPGPADYSRAFYKRADLQDDLRVHI